MKRRNFIAAALLAPLAALLPKKTILGTVSTTRWSSKVSTLWSPEVLETYLRRYLPEGHAYLTISGWDFLYHHPLPPRRVFKVYRPSGGMPAGYCAYLLRDGRFSRIDMKPFASALEVRDAISLAKTRPGWLTSEISSIYEDEVLVGGDVEKLWRGHQSEE